MPWTALDRLLLEAGLFPAPYEPVSNGELAALLIAAREARAPALADPGERALLAALVERYGGEQPEAGARLGGRLRLDQVGLGDVTAGEAGHNLPPGLSAALEPTLAVRRGPWWAAATARLQGRLLDSGDAAAPGLLHAGWPEATGLPQLGRARRDDGPARLDWPRAVAGRRLGRWAASVGWAPRRAGPGLGGALTLDRTGRSFPAVTLRRTAPFAWRGPARHLAPRHLLLRVGLLSAQDLAYEVGLRREERRDRPWFLQWLVTWRHAAWLRTTVAAATLAAPRSGTLWPDLLQTNFPLLGATQAETRRGPLTDRIFSLQFEARWRRAPWPLLPAAAGRLWWEYAGEDFQPSDLLGFVPQISAPASVVGCELLSPRWDLAGEYAELRHPDVLWYDHSNFRGGYRHDGWLLAHPLGGSGEQLTGILRWRPPRSAWQLELLARHETHGDMRRAPGRAERDTWSLALSRPAARLRWRLDLARIREEAAAPETPAAAQEWWRVTWGAEY